VILASDTLPSNTGYVAAAYLVFLALLLIYVAIMAFKLARFERDAGELNELADRRAAADGRQEPERVAVGSRDEL
jgi:cytochrome c-type biogenesis protein CcmH/NrfG